VKKIFLILFLFFYLLNIHAQNMDDLYFGTDASLEVITWNIEWFPKNGQNTADYVSEIILRLDADIIAMQELSDTILFNQMLSGMDDYSGYYESSYFAGLAYIYKHDHVEINDLYEIYTTQPYWRPFPRSPMVLDFDFRGENYILINNHLKCCGDGSMDLEDSWDEETRRYDAMNLIKEYVDAQLSDRKVFILGDLNDLITDELEHNVFRNLLEDTDNYLFADYDIAHGSTYYWSYPTWPSHLDHIIISNELFEEFHAPFTYVRTLRIEDYLPGGWSDYDQYVSDHRPVAMRFLPSSTNLLLGKDFEDQNLLSGGWTQHNIAGEQEWHVPEQDWGVFNTYCAYMSGFDDGPMENENWLISPLIDTGDHEEIRFSFWNTTAYQGAQLQVFYSDNYSGNPHDANWMEIEDVNWHDGNTNWQWTYSGEADLDHLAGTSFHIGFKYTSSSQQAATWEIDDVIVTGNPESVTVSTDRPGIHNQQAYDHSNIRIFPNPVDNQLFIDGIDGPADVSVLDLSGATVMQKQLPGNSMYVGNLMPGIYIVKIETDHGVFMQKFVRQ